VLHSSAAPSLDYENGRGVADTLGMETRAMVEIAMAGSSQIGDVRRILWTKCHQVVFRG